MFEICSDLPKIGLKINYYCQHSKKSKKKWPNGQTILFLANSFKKGQILKNEKGQIKAKFPSKVISLKRSNGNPD